MHAQTLHTVPTPAAMAERITHRRALFLPGGAPDTELDALADADEADLHTLAGMPNGSHADHRAKAAVLAHRDLSGGMSLGEAALLRSLLSALVAPPAPVAAPSTQEALWTAAELAAFLAVSPHTVTHYASQCPDRLPPRVAAMKVQRWSPETCRAWVNGTLPARPRVGRPRNS
jgi:hypothetical protein